VGKSEDIKQSVFPTIVFSIVDSEALPSARIKESSEFTETVGELKWLIGETRTLAPVSSWIGLSSIFKLPPIEREQEIFELEGVLQVGRISFT
jgi:hypothetical protein